MCLVCKISFNTEACTHIQNVLKMVNVVLADVLTSTESQSAEKGT